MITKGKLREFTVLVSVRERLSELAFELRLDRGHKLYGHLRKVSRHTEQLVQKPLGRGVGGGRSNVHE